MNLNFFLNSVRNFFQRQLYFHTKIASAAYSSAATSIAASAKETFKRTVFSEDASEVREDVFHVHSLSASAETCITYTLVTELVILRFLLGVAKHFIGFSRFFEFIFCFFI